MKLVQTFSVKLSDNSNIGVSSFPEKFNIYNTDSVNIDDYVTSIKLQQTGRQGVYGRVLISLNNMLIQQIQQLFPPAMSVHVYDGKIQGFVSNVD